MWINITKVTAKIKKRTSKYVSYNVHAHSRISGTIHFFMLHMYRPFAEV